MTIWVSFCFVTCVYVLLFLLSFVVDITNLIMRVHENFIWKNYH